MALEVCLIIDWKQLLSFLGPKAEYACEVEGCCYNTFNRRRLRSHNRMEHSSSREVGTLELTEQAVMALRHTNAGGEPICRSHFNPPTREDDDRTKLLTFLAFLGPSGIARTALLAMPKERKLWNEDGELEWTGPPKQLPDFITSQDRLEHAIALLETDDSISTIVEPCGYNSDADRRYWIDTTLRSCFIQHAQNPVQWKVMIARFAYHVFPRDRDLDPL